MIHQIINSDQFNGAGRRVFRQFVDEVVEPSGGDLYLSVRKENAVACRFYERHGMKVAGAVAWKKKTVPGLVYRLPARTMPYCRANQWNRVPIWKRELIWSMLSRHERKVAV